MTSKRLCGNINSMDMHIGLTLKSKNAKTGEIPVSISSNVSCPSACPLSQGGCYAKHHYLGKHWQLVSDKVRGLPFAVFLDKIVALPLGSLWRHNVAGDLPGIGNTIDKDAMRALVRANKGKKGFTYTHKPPTPGNLNLIEEANREGFTVNLSSNSLAHADELKAISLAPVVTLLPIGTKENTFTPDGHKVVVCPATTKENVTCKTCKLCAIPNRQVIIGFPAHGASAKKAEALADGIIVLPSLLTEAA